MKNVLRISGKEMFVFQKNLHVLFSWNTCFVIHPFTLLPTTSHFILTIFVAVLHFVAFRSPFATVGNLSIFWMLSWILFSKERTTEKLVPYCWKALKVREVPQEIFNEYTVRLIKFVNTFCHFLKISAITYFHDHIFLLQENRSTQFFALVIKVLLPAITIRLVFLNNKVKFVKKSWDWNNAPYWLQIC